MCKEGFFQKAPIVLGCSGGKASKTVRLTQAGSEHSSFQWVAPQNTRDLLVNITVEPMEETGLRSAALTAQCVEGGSSASSSGSGRRKLGADGRHELLLGAEDGVLRASSRGGPYRGEVLGATWTWSGDPDPRRRGSTTETLGVNGTLGCDVEFTFANLQPDVQAFSASIVYSWVEVSPCPDVMPGCEPCPTDRCRGDQEVVCDGSKYWSCVARGGRDQAPPVDVEFSAGLNSVWSSGSFNMSIPTVEALPDDSFLPKPAEVKTDNKRGEEEAIRLGFLPDDENATATTGQESEFSKTMSKLFGVLVICLTSMVTLLGTAFLCTHFHDRLVGPMQYCENAFMKTLQSKQKTVTAEQQGFPQAAANGAGTSLPPQTAGAGVEAEGLLSQASSDAGGV